MNWVSTLIAILIILSAPALIIYLGQITSITGTYKTIILLRK